MDYLRNHCWCSDSNWGGNYDCQIIVGLQSYEEGYKEDWDNLIVKKPITQVMSLPNYPEFEYETTYSDLKDEVIDWLHENVQDFKDQKGWCVGSIKYSLNNGGCSYSVFFQRRKDAMKFIKTWSKWKKPIFYCQYFTNIRKELDLNTGKYIER